MEAGDILGEKYRLGPLLGEGGMGAVFDAVNLNTGRRVAVKVLHGQWARQPEVVQRFLREARATTTINHPNVVEILDLDVDRQRGTPYIVQEFLVGRPLDALLRDLGGRGLSAFEALEILAPAMSALAAAHALGIVHRDIKPANVFLARGRNGERITKVIDFGIAKEIAATVSNSHRTQEGTVIGTPAYMSPEQAAGAADIDARTDVWSLGVLLYELLTGRLPYEAPNQNVLVGKILYEAPVPVGERDPSLPADVVALVEGALRRDRAQRFATVEAMLACARGVRVSAPATPAAADATLLSTPPSPPQPSTLAGAGPSAPPAPPVAFAATAVHDARPSAPPLVATAVGHATLVAPGALLEAARSPDTISAVAKSAPPARSTRAPG